MAFVRALGVAALLLACGAQGAAAEQTEDTALPDDAGTPEGASLDAPLAEPPVIDLLSGGSRPDTLLLYSGFDLWHFSLASYGGLQWAPQGQNDDGFLLRLFMSENIELYRGPTATTRTGIFRAALLPGWRLTRGNVEMKLFAGLDFDYQISTLGSDGPHGSRPGLRVAAETWWEPRPELMLASSLSATTISAGYAGRVAAGWKMLDRFWAGPEFLASRDEYSTQYRVGAHLTGLKIEDFEYSAAIGYLEDSFKRSGPYVRLGVLTRR